MKIAARGGNASPRTKKIVTELSNKLMQILLNESSDIAFESLSIVVAIYIKEYMDMAEESGATITEDEVYNTFVEGIKERLENMVFIPDQKN
jgi:hypothetical protein